MSLLFKMNWSLWRTALENLQKPHEFAFERVGFFYCRAAALAQGLMVLADSYEPVADCNYIKDNTVGARINGSAIRQALQASLNKNASLFHVHVHEHAGPPRPSRTDLVESKKFVPDFFNVTPTMPHGTIILSQDSAFGLCWFAKGIDPEPFTRIEIVGSPLRIVDRRI